MGKFIADINCHSISEIFVLSEDNSILYHLISVNLFIAIVDFTKLISTIGWLAALASNQRFFSLALHWIKKHPYKQTDALGKIWTPVISTISYFIYRLNKQCVYRLIARVYLIINLFTYYYKLVHNHFIYVIIIITLIVILTWYTCLSRHLCFLNIINLCLPTCTFAHLNIWDTYFKYHYPL